MTLALRALLLLSCLGPAAQAAEPIRPLPREPEYDHPRAALGMRLFFDTHLSSDGQIACASCHIPAMGGAEPRPVSVGVEGRRGNTNAPTVYNAYYNFRQFWNGRAADLREQAAGPLHNPKEMNMEESQLEARVNGNEYRADFAAIYGERRYGLSEVTDAIAEFEKALITPNARFDRWLRGEIELSEGERRGYRLFKHLGCVTCHNGINIGGNSYQYLGAVVPMEWQEGMADRYAVTGDPKDKNRFKVPSLRNITLTAPYLHDGSQATLREVLETMALHNIGFTLEPHEVDALLAFLRTLTGETPAILRGE